MFILSIWNSLLCLGNECYVMSLDGKQCLLLTVEAENAKCLFPSFHIGRLCHSMGNANEKYLPQWSKSESPPTFFLQGMVASAATSVVGAASGDMVLAMVLAASCPPYSYPFFICGSCSILFQNFSFSHTPLKKFFFLLNQPELVFVVWNSWPNCSSDTSDTGKQLF